MTRLALVASTVVAVVVGIAASIGAVTQPAAAPGTLQVERAAFLSSPAGQVQFSCGFFAGKIGWRHGLAPEERDRIAAACKRLAGELTPLIPLEREEICGVIVEDAAFDYLPQKIRDTILSSCATESQETP